ncbi:hypothetical protein OIE66_04765 [Nonomuraea sp. NBC_01738]|uniref:hypothetical protein n=1 Tax=Nonomuraea sp. NBC_01738 TaxID=2976003 RepID=UPI002E0D3478|nr:hypothetical protein OIE66_04765 [Nonomuraea sp. NBC_01738]
MRITRFAGIAVVLAALLAVPLPPSASADPGSQAELRKLTKQAAQLNKLYRGQIQSLEEVRIQAKKATETADRLKSQLANARGDVAGIAATSYMTGPLDNIQLFTNPMEPYQLLGQAANLRYMADERTQRVVQIQTLIKKAAEAKKASDQKIKELQRELKTMQSKRRDVEKLLAKYGFQTPTGGEGLTQRMTSVKITVMQNFPMPYGVGCLRPGDPGEHGKGRACDFMMSRGMATGADADRGDALAEYLIKNGARLGVMYIIWKQRYYDIRSGGGWDPMSDRGSITANHWDHVHVSVF